MTDTVICAEGLVCAFDGTTSSCVKPKADGSTCASDAECQSTNCNTQTNSCDPLAPIGAACASTSECKDGYCDATALKCTARYA